MQFSGVQYVCPRHSFESADLKPGIGEDLFTLGAEEKYSAVGRHQAPLMPGEKMKRFHVSHRQLP